jgi:carboxymethylenebutenolidase
MTIHASNVQLNANGREFQAYLAEPGRGGPGILLLHAWWGLKPFFKQVCDRLAEQGFIVLAPDLRAGKVAQTVDEAMEMQRHAERPEELQAAGETVMAAKDYLRKLPELKCERIGVIGFSMGGGWALVAAEHAPEQVAAVVLFYGNGEVDPSKVQAAVQGHFSDVDEWEPYEFVQRLESGLKKAGAAAEFHVYQGRKHWFVEEDRPEYDAEAAQLAWERTIRFLKATVCL